MAGSVAVIDTVIVAALGNGNDTVVLIDTVDDQESMSFVSTATIRGVKRTQQAGYFVGAALDLLRITRLALVT